MRTRKMRFINMKRLLSLIIVMVMVLAVTPTAVLAEKSVRQIPIQIIWDDANNQDSIRPEEVNIPFPTGTVTLNETNNWTSTFILPESGSFDLGKYVPEGYVAEFYFSEEDILTMAFTQETQATVKKVWDDAGNQDGIRPESLSVTLLANGEATNKVATLNEANEWTATINGLPKYENGAEIAYTWTEGELPEGYTLTDTYVNGIVTTLTNTHTPEETEATVKKVWDDAGNQDNKRPGTLVVTLSNGTSVTLSENNSWTANVTGLPKYKDGTEISYTWIESDLPEGYVLTDTAIEGNITTLTNTIQYQLDYKYDEGGSGSMQSQTVTIGQEFTFPECKFTPPKDKVFDHWKMSGVDGSNEVSNDVVNGIFYPGSIVKIAGNCALNGVITVTAYWKDVAIVKEAPGVKNLTYNGKEQELVTPGKAEGGTMNYAIGTDETTAPTTGWSDSIPSATAVGIYYVWYKVVGDGNHGDTESKGPIKVTISRPYSGGRSISIPLTAGGSGETINITGTITGSTVSLNTITEATFNKAVRTDGSMVIDASGLKRDIKEIRFNAATVKNLKSSDVQSLEIILTDGSIILDKKAIETVEAASTGAGPLKVHIDKVDVSTLTKAQQEALEGVDSPLILTVTITRGNVEIHNLNGGKITFKARYESSEGKAPDVFYLTEAGALERVTNTEYKDGFLTWTENHCSVYVVKEISADSYAVDKMVDTLGEDPDPEKVAEARAAYEALGDKKSEIDGSVVKTLEAAEQKVAEATEHKAALGKAAEAVKAAEKYKDDAAVKAAREELEKTVKNGKTEDIIKAAETLDSAVKAAEAAEKAKKAAEEKEAAEKKAAQEKAAKAARELADARSAAQAALKAVQPYSGNASVKAAINTLNAAIKEGNTAKIKAAIAALNKAVKIASAPKATTIKITTESKTFKASTLEKKTRTFKIKYKKTKGSGKAVFNKVSGSKILTVSKAGKVRIKKGTKKGTYKVKVKVTVAANKTYKAGTAARTIKVKVK